MHPSLASTPAGGEASPLMHRRAFLGSLGALAAPSLAFGDVPAGEEIHLLAMGDWGASHEMKDPDDNPKVRLLQNNVAAALAAYAGELAAAGKKLTAVLALGDNFYGPLSGPEDDRFKKRFEELYPSEKLGVPFYFLMGNHEYEDDEKKNWKHQIAYAAANPEGRWTWPAQGDATWYRQNLPAATTGSPLLTIIGLDTNTDHVKKTDWPVQVKFLQDEMAKAKDSTWRIVMAHHPMWTDGYHWNRETGLYKTIRETILPELGEAVFYVSAHDHNLQHIQHKDHPKTHFFISGAGGGDFTKKRQRLHPVGYKNEFFKSTGFLHLSFSAKEARAQFVAVSGKTWKPVGAGAVVTKA